MAASPLLADGRSQCRHARIDLIHRSSDEGQAQVRASGVPA
jgi:hypothetical protein